MHWNEKMQMIWLGLKNGAVAGIREERAPIVHWFPSETRVVSICSNRQSLVWAVNSTHMMLIRGEHVQETTTEIGRSAVVGLVCVGENAWLVQLRGGKTQVSVWQELTVQSQFTIQVG